MYHSLRRIGSPTKSPRALVFVRGFQGLSKLKGTSPQSSSWSRALRNYGYRGNMLSYCWSSSWQDCRSAKCRAELAEEAGDTLWELLQKLDIDFERVSLMGFSMGATVIQQLLWQARRASTKFRRVYFLGGEASSRARWGDLLQAVREGTWNFYSENDVFLRSLCRDPIGVSGFDYHYPNTREIDLTWYEDDPDGERAITSHSEWLINVVWCLQRARLTLDLL
jgi:pimeloyl-ACP methyl ester carboxylesterase